VGSVAGGGRLGPLRHTPHSTPPPPLPHLQALNAARVALPAALAVTGAGALAGPALASGDTLEPPEYAWDHKGPFSTFDAAR
jgi:hypothetical protein